MAGEERQANVVLTANNADYDRTMKASAQETAQLERGVDSLTAKLNNLSKAGGRKLQIVGAADAAAVAGVTAAYASYESQLEQLQAQSASLQRTQDAGTQVFKRYEGAVKSLRQEFPTTTRDAAALVTTISQMADGTKSVDALSKSFMQLGKATGENPAQLSQGVLQLTRSMGNSQDKVAAYNNSILTLAKNTGQSAGALVSFSQQLAPAARQIGMSQEDVLGVSAAFAKAGADGNVAANSFNQMLNDISVSTQQGSPKLAQYANLLGVTVESFKEMDKTDATIKIFDTLNEQGPKAIDTLNRMGFDGQRMLRSLQAVSQQSGGIGASIAQSRNAFAEGGGKGSALDRSSKAAIDGLADSFGRLTDAGKRAAETIGANFAGPMNLLVDLLTKATDVTTAFFASGPGKLAAWAVGLAAPLALATGSLMKMAGALSTLAGISFIGRGSAMAGLLDARAGFRGGAAGVTALEGAGLQSRTGRSINAGRGNFLGNALYTGGMGLGSMIFADPADRARRTGPGLLSRAAALPLRGAGAGLSFLASTYSPAMYNPLTNRGGMVDATQRARMFNSGTLSGALANGAGTLSSLAGGRVGQAAEAARDRIQTRRAGTAASQMMAMMAEGKAGTGPAQTSARAAADMQSANAAMARSSTAAASALTEAGKGAKGLTAGLGSMAAGVKDMGLALAGSAAGGARVAGGVAMRGAGMAASGLASFAMANPLMLGLAAGTGGYMAYNALRDKTTYERGDQPGAMDPYLAKQGITAPGQYTGVGTKTAVQGEVTSLERAGTITEADQTEIAAGRKLTNKALRRYDSVDEATAFLQTGYKAQTVRSPQAMQDMKLDLVQQYGQEDAQKILDNLANGGLDQGDFLRTWGKNIAGAGNNKATGDQIQALGEAFGIRRQQAAVGGGPRDAAQQGRADLAQYIKLITPSVAANKRQREGFDEGFSDLFNKGEDVDISLYKEAGLAPDEAGGTQQLKTAAQAQRSITEQLAREGLSDRALADLGVGKKYIADREKYASQIADYISGSQNVDVSTAFGGKLNEGVSARQMRAAGRGTEQNFTRMFTSDTQGSPVTEALMSPADTNKQIAAVDSVTQSMLKMGQSYNQIIDYANRQKQAIGDETNARYILMDAISQNAQALQQMRDMPYMSRQQRSELVNQQYSNVVTEPQRLGTDASDPNYQARLKAAEQMQASNEQEQTEYYKSLYVQFREFKIQQTRAEEDFARQRGRMDYQYHLQRSRQDEDYNLQRERSDEDYNRQRARAENDFARQRRRAVADYTLGEKRGFADFNRSRLRQEEDFHHQQELMSKQAARSMYDIYKQVNVQNTASAGQMLMNGQDQIDRMNQQSRQLDQIRKMGVSDDVIQQLGLTDANNQQQLARFTEDLMNDPSMVKTFNDQVKKRLGSAKKLVQDESSAEWEELTYQYKKSRSRAQEDFDRQVSRSRKDFKKQLDRQAKDFSLMMDRQAEDYERGMDRQKDDYNKMMKRSAADYALAVEQMTSDFSLQMTRATTDINRMSTEVTGSLEDITTKAMGVLDGSLKKQAKAVRDNFRGIKTETVSQSEDIVKALESIFGVDFGGKGKVSKGSNGSGPSTTSGSGKSRNDVGGSPNVGGVGGAGHSHDASCGHTAPANHLMGAGGPPLGGSGGSDPDDDDDKATVHKIYAPMTSGYRITSQFGERASIRSGPHTGQDWAAPSGKPFKAVMDGKVYSTAYVGWGGNIIKINHGSKQETWYAHSSAQKVGRGDVVRGGQIIGNVGSVGNSTGPHLHLEYHRNGRAVDPRLLWAKGGVSYANNHMGAGSSGKSKMVDIQTVLKDKYSKVEKAVSSLKLAGGLPAGYMSKKINEMATRAAKKYAPEGTHSGPTGDGAGADYSGLSNLGGSAAANKRLVKEMAGRRGWGEGPQWRALNSLIMGESGYRNTAQNPSSTAYGIFQFLNGTWAGTGIKKTSDPRRQTIAGFKYIEDRYGDPIKANTFKKAHNWYGDGQIFNAGAQQGTGVGERGAEMLLPLNYKGVDFLSSLVEKLSFKDPRGNARGSVPVTNNYYQDIKIDKGTHFHGGFTIVSSNPAEMMAQLQAMQRARALTQPSLIGVGQ